MNKLIAFLALLLLTPTLWGAPASQIKCSPKTLNLGDTLNIKLRLPHGEDFVVFDPDGKEYWLSATGDYHDSHSPSHYRADDFRNMSEIELNPSQLKLVQFTHGKVESELVFSKPGLYRIAVSTNLATDDGTPSYSCSIKFTNEDSKVSSWLTSPVGWATCLPT